MLSADVEYAGQMIFGSLATKLGLDSSQKETIDKIKDAVTGGTIDPEDPNGESLGGIAGQVIVMKDATVLAQDEAAAAAAAALANEAQLLLAQEEINKAKDSLGTKANKKDIPTDVPGWQSLNPIEDVVFPSQDIVPVPTIVNGLTSFDGSEYGHTHYHNATITWVEPTYTPVAGVADFLFINATRKRIYNTLGFITAAQTGPLPSAFVAAVYKMDTTDGVPNGNMTKVAEVNTNIISKLSQAAENIRIPLGVDIEAEAGDWYAVALIQGGTTRKLLGKQTSRFAAPTGVNPKRLAMSVSGLSVWVPNLASTYFDTNSTFVPWACLGQITTRLKARLSDLFDRGNSSTLGTNWNMFGIGIEVVNGQARSKLIDYGPLKNRENWTRAVYNGTMTTPSQGVRVKLGPWPSHGRDYRSQAALRSNSDMTRYVAMGFRPGYIEIRAYTPGNPNGVTVASTLFDFSTTSGSVAELHATMNQYTVQINGVGVLEWQDRDNVVGSDVEIYNRAGMELYAYSYGGSLLNGRDVWPSVGFDEWEAFER